MVLSQCLQRYDRTEEEVADDMGPTPEHHLTANVNGSQLVSELGPSLGLYPTSPYRSKSEGSEVSVSETSDRAGSASKGTTNKTRELQLPGDQPILIVDDNAINRRLLAAFMKKRKLPYQEAKDGQQALQAYQDADGKFDIILMDISMPVMDGMTSTRLIRQHENIKDLKAAHIIALTGLTSASAKLEAWTSGVDDFLTKPVDFNKLESLMKAGRGGEGTGFLSGAGREDHEELVLGRTKDALSE